MDLEEYLPYSKKKKKPSSLPLSNWEEVDGKIQSRLNPKQIRFTHETISNKFSSGNRLSEAIEDIKNGTLLVDDFPPIRVVFYKQLFWSLDNRRLYVFKEASVASVPGKSSFFNNPLVVFVEGKDKSFWRKLTSSDFGK